MTTATGHNFYVMKVCDGTDRGLGNFGKSAKAAFAMAARNAIAVPVAVAIYGLCASNAFTAPLASTAAETGYKVAYRQAGHIFKPQSPVFRGI